MKYLIFSLSLIFFSCQITTVRNPPAPVPKLEQSEIEKDTVDLYELPMSGICWDTESGKNIFIKSQKILDIGENYNFLFVKENQEILHYRNCIYELDQPLKKFNPGSDHLDFNCMIGGYSIAGRDYTLVKSFGNIVFWVLSEKTGQNIFVSKSNCEFSVVSKQE